MKQLHMDHWEGNHHLHLEHHYDHHIHHLIDRVSVCYYQKGHLDLHHHFHHFFLGVQKDSIASFKKVLDLNMHACLITASVLNTSLMSGLVLAISRGTLLGNLIKISHCLLGTKSTFTPWKSSVELYTLRMGVFSGTYNRYGWCIHWRYLNICNINSWLITHFSIA